jgi:hypothetical protein
MNPALAKIVWLALVILNGILLGVIQIKFWRLVKDSPVKRPQAVWIAHLYATTGFGIAYALASCLLYIVYYSSPVLSSIARHGLAVTLPLLFVGLEIQLLWRTSKNWVRRNPARQMSTDG